LASHFFSAIKLKVWPEPNFINAIGNETQHRWAARIQNFK